MWELCIRIILFHCSWYNLIFFHLTNFFFIIGEMIFLLSIWHEIEMAQSLISNRITCGKKHIILWSISFSRVYYFFSIKYEFAWKFFVKKPPMLWENYPGTRIVKIFLRENLNSTIYDEFMKLLCFSLLTPVEDLGGKLPSPCRRKYGKRSFLWIFSRDF